MHRLLLLALVTLLIPLQRTAHAQENSGLAQALHTLKPRSIGPAILRKERTKREIMPEGATWAPGALGRRTTGAPHRRALRVRPDAITGHL